jgi:hypothetical protein
MPPWAQASSTKSAWRKKCGGQWSVCETTLAGKFVEYFLNLLTKSHMNSKVGFSPNYLRAIQPI